MTRLILALTLLAPGSALAGKCDALASKADSAKADALVSAYTELMACDKAEAEAAYSEFVRAAEDTDTTVGLAVVAIEAQAYLPVWSMLDDIKDYSQRDAISKAVGDQCKDHPDIVNFLQGAYFGLKNTAFGKWDEALISCESDSLQTFIDNTAAAPPAVTYDEKYNTLLKVLVTRQGPDALPVLQRAAVEAATNGGPFNAIIEKMNDAVVPDELGADIPPEDRKRLEKVLVSVAGAVAPEQAAMVADRLFNAGAEKAAASLLPNIYPDKVQSDGSLLYGVAAIENCDNQAYIHYAAVTEPAKRWSIMADVEAPARGAKQRLKCATDGSWPVIATSEPVASEADLMIWITDVQKQWENKGNSVKVRQEKGIALN